MVNALTLHNKPIHLHFSDTFVVRLIRAMEEVYKTAEYGSETHRN